MNADWGTVPISTTTPTPAALGSSSDLRIGATYTWDGITWPSYPYVWPTVPSPRPDPSSRVQRALDDLRAAVRDIETSASALGLDLSREVIVDSVCTTVRDALRP